MTRRQTIILAVLAVLDLAVIGGMAAYVIRASRQTPVPVAEPDPCTAAILDALAAMDEAVVVDWSAGDASADAPVGAAYLGVAFSETTVPAPSELVWELLDALPRDLGDRCPTPVNVVLTVHTGTPRTSTQTAVMSGTVLMDWTSGALSDDDLAAHVRYRIASGP